MAGRLRLFNCVHGTVTNRHPHTGQRSYGDDPWFCSQCGAEQPNPLGCSHSRIDNDTWRCRKCNERMVCQRVETQTILSAPNANVCRDPAHLAVIAAGEDPQCNNVYVPDYGRAREVPIAYEFTYECADCRDGHRHTGDTIPILWGV